MSNYHLLFFLFIEKKEKKIHASPETQEPVLVFLMAEQ